jgi:replicative DNA helicase
MAKKSLIYKVFIASPSDVKDEVKVLTETIYRWNSINSEKYSVFLNPSNWRTDSYPEMGDEPQKLINKQIVDIADILIGVFWNRIGTPTSDAPSGTVEEIEKFISEGKPTLLYFSSRSVDPYSIDQIQFNKVKEIKQKYINKGIIWEFSEIPDFREQVFGHLSATVSKLFEDDKSIDNDIKTEKAKLSDSLDDKPAEILNSSPIGNVLISCFEKIEKVHKDKPSGITLGFNDLDLMIPEIIPGSVLLFSGYSGVGKTSLLRSLCINISVNRKISCAVFTLDGDKLTFTNKTLCGIAGLDPWAVFTGNIRRVELPKISFAAGPLSEAPLLLIDEMDISSENILSSIKVLGQSGVKVIFIDNLHMIHTNKDSYTEFFRSLKNTAYQTNTAILIFCTIDQLKGHINTRPVMINLQQYGNIASFVDVIGFLYRTDDVLNDKKIAYELIIAKNYCGPIGTANISYDPLCLKFGDYRLDRNF